jgi:hypothetical protein
VLIFLCWNQGALFLRVECKNPILVLCGNQGALLLHLHAAPTWMPRYLFYVCMVRSPFEHFPPLVLLGFPTPSIPSGWPNCTPLQHHVKSSWPNYTPLQHHVKSFLPHSISSYIFRPCCLELPPSLWDPWATLGSMSNFWSHRTWQFFCSRPSIPFLGCLIYGSPWAHPCLVPFVPIRPFRFSSISSTKCSFQWFTLESYI